MNNERRISYQREIIDKLQRDYRSARDELASANKENAALRAENEALRESVSALEKMYDEIVAKYRDEIVKLHKLKSHYESLINQIGVAHREYEKEAGALIARLRKQK